MNIFKALSYLIEGLSRSVAFDILGIGLNKITAEHKFYLLLLILFSKSLLILTLTKNNLRGSMPLIAPGLSHSNLKYIHLNDCSLDDNDIICLGRALHRNFKVIALDISENNISPHAFSELLLAIQYSAISTVTYDGQTTVAHMIMLNAINSNRHTADMPTLHLKDTDMQEFPDVQCGGLCMASLPPEFLTGQEGVPNPYLPSEFLTRQEGITNHYLQSESEQETDTHSCLTQ